MTTETVLTDEQVRNIIEDVDWPNKEVFNFTVEVSRAIEQAVLQSEQVKALRKDAERYRWLRDSYGLYDLPYKDHGLGPEFPDGEALDATIDDAMEQQT